MSVSISGAGSISGLDQGLNVTSGSVGVGTDNPTADLEVYNSNQAVMAVRGDKSTLAVLGDDSNSGASETDARIILCSDGTIANTPAALTTSPLAVHGFEIALINDEPGSGLRLHDGSVNAERLRITKTGKVGIGTDTPGAVLEVFDETSNTILNVKSGDAGAVLNLIDDSARSSIEQNGTTLKISSDTGAEDASSDIRLQVDGSTKMLIRDSGDIVTGVPGNDNQNHTGSRTVFTVADTTNGALLHVRGQSPAVFFDQSSGGIGKVFLDSADFAIQSGTPASEGTERVRITSAGQITVGGAVFNYQGTSKPYNNSAGTLWGTSNIALTGQWSTINWPSDHSDPEPSQPWYMMGRPHGSTDNWALSIRPGSSNALYDIIECDNDSNGYISNLKFHTSNGQERLRILSNGHVNIGGYLSSVTNSGLHVGRNTGGTAAGESVIAATLGNDSTMVSALLTVKNAGNRGSQGHSSGSPLAKFEFNNGTAFEIDKNGYRTLPYQPCAMAYNAQGQFLGGASVAQFNSTRFNIGNMYNSTNGRMTVPVAGRYLVAYSGLHDYISQASVGFDIRINGSQFNGGEGYQESNDITNSQLSKTLILDLSANDYVEIYIRSSGTRVHQRYGSFSMCLIT